MVLAFNVNFTAEKLFTSIRNAGKLSSEGADNKLQNAASETF